MPFIRITFEVLAASKRGGFCMTYVLDTQAPTYAHSRNEWPDHP